ncbi:LOW QUALITY PROTEIN: hypothetical protein PHMEG_0009232 [Phytophthora megakarya]|uniref:Uncharacterized protein n=1 Tax=Phytophthora megakarya TaxID=4795 RepID=A0A225WIH0_9STRA|nr:LOW QUALITY PROTEIN: hypothetical protein PHMEG_0009232 [Phytophthora megakarya]
MCELAKLVVGMARQPPARVNSYLDQRLDSASTVQEVLAAAVAPHRFFPQDELDAERGLANEVQLRTAAEADTMRYVIQERERMKAGLTAENASLRRANSVLRKNSGEHGLNIDALILSTAGLFASGLDWELLGLEVVARGDHSKGSVRSQETSPLRYAFCWSTFATKEPSGTDNSVEVDFDVSSPVDEVKSLQLPAQDDKAKSLGVPGHFSAGLAPPSRPPVEILDLTSDDAVGPSRKKASSPFSSPIVSYFPHKDGRPRRSSSVASELRMKGSLEKELADDGFMLGLTAEDSVAGGMSSAQRKRASHSSASPAGARAVGISTQPAPTSRHESGVGIQGGSRPRRQTHLFTATVTARRGTDTSAFAPAATVVSRAVNSRKLTATAERFLEPGFAAVRAQNAWCQMLNVSLSESAPKDHVSPLDFAFLALMYNVYSARHPWRVLFDHMPDEPLTFDLGKLVQGVRIYIRASGHGGLVLMWRRFSGHCYEDNEKIDLCVAFWEHRHWLRVPALDNAIRKFKEDPLDPFTHVILGLWHHLNLEHRADLLHQQIDQLWEWCTGAGGRTLTLPTEVLLEPSYLQYSTEVLEWAPATKDWFRELRVLEAKQRWRNGWIDAPAEHPYNTTYAPCNPTASHFVPTSMTRQAVISDIVVDQSLADADLVAPWINKVTTAVGITESSPAGTAEESSVGAENAPPASVEPAEALNEDSFSFVPVETAASGPGSAATESSATPAGVEVPAHNAEEPPSDIVLAPFEMLVQIATSERLASE